MGEEMLVFAEGGLWGPEARGVREPGSGGSPASGLPKVPGGAGTAAAPGAVVAQVAVRGPGKRTGRGGKDGEKPPQSGELQAEEERCKHLPPSRGRGPCFLLGFAGRRADGSEAASPCSAPPPRALLPQPCHQASPRPWVLASMISLMRPEPTLFLAASFTLYHVPHLRLSSLKARSPELMNTSFHSSLLSTEYCSTKPAGSPPGSGRGAGQGTGIAGARLQERGALLMGRG